MSDAIVAAERDTRLLRDSGLFLKDAKRMSETKEKNSVNCTKCKQKKSSNDKIDKGNFNFNQITEILLSAHFKYEQAFLCTMFNSNILNCY